MVYHPYFAGAAKGGYTRKYYDAFGRLSMLTRTKTDGPFDYKFIRPDDLIATPIYDYYHNRKSLLITRYAYDDVTLINGAATMRSVTDPEGRIKRVYSDLAGRVMRVTEAAGTPNETHVDYTYYENDLLKSVSSPQGKTTITYNSLNQQASLTDPNAGMTRYTYYETQGAPSFGQIKTEVRPDPNSPADSANTITLTNEYQASFGRLSRQYYGSAASPKLNRVFTYDDIAVNHSKGKLTRVVSKSGGYNLQKDFSYDIYGRTLSELRNISHASDTLCSDATALPCRSLSSWTYDKLGRLKSMTHPNNAAIQYEYIGGTGLFQKIKDTAKDYVSYSGYNVYGQPGKMASANGVDTSYEYEPGTSMLSRLKVGVSIPPPASTDPDAPPEEPAMRYLLDYGYQFDMLGNIAKITDHILPELTSFYTYDDLNRLAAVNRAGTSLKDFSYSFDQNGLSNQTQGNLIDKDELVRKRLCYQADCNVSSTERTSKPHHERVWNAVSRRYVRNNDTHSFSWSAAGNLLSKTNTTHGATTYTYDAENMLKTLSAPKGESVSHYYDESGQRFLKEYEYKEGTDRPTIRTYYLTPQFEMREKWDGTTRSAFQSTLYITRADGHRAVSKTSGAYLNSPQASSETSYRMAGMFNSSDLRGLLLKSKYLLLGFYQSPDFAKHLWLALAFLGFVFAFGLVFYCRHQASAESRYHWLQRICASCMILMILFAFGCVSEKNYEYLNEDVYPSSGFSILMGGASGGLPVGTYYYHSNHLGSTSLVTDNRGEEVMRLNYTPYGEIDQAHSGKLGCSGGADIAYKDCSGNNSWSKFYDVVEGDSAGVIRRFTGQEYDPESSLYYYNARYYDPSIGIFTTADTVVPSSTDPMAYNRYMYVRGNPVIYTDPTGNFFIGLLIAAVVVGVSIAAAVSKPFREAISTFVSALFSPITAIISGIQSAITGQNFLDTFVNNFNGVKSVVGAALLIPIAINPFATGIISAANGGNFWEGFGAGLMNLSLAAVTFGGSFGLSIFNAYAGGYHGIYSRDEQGDNAFLLDHTVGQGTTAAGTIAAVVHLAGKGGKFEKDLSRGSNAFIFSNSPLRSNSVGNVVGLSPRDSARLNTPGGKAVLREELLHNWQYRRGGLLSLTRLGLEQLGAFGNPYTTRGTLEYDASTRALDGTNLERGDGYSGFGKSRPWELRCVTCGRFY